jgi:hypothetical protein
MSVAAAAILEKQPGESRLYYVDFTALLRKDTSGALAETLSSPTIAAVSGLTIASVAVNTAAIVRDDLSEIAIGAAVQFRVSSGTDGTTYEIEVVSTTTLSNTLEQDVRLQVVD